MKLAGRVLALLLLALWMPANMHCLLEHVPLFSFLGSCCSEQQASDSSTPCDGDQCCPVESGKYMVNWSDRLDTRGTTLVAVPLPAIAADLSLPAPKVTELPPDPFEDCSPWHLVFRAVGEPRAPSNC